jgi:hypothetical protein
MATSRARARHGLSCSDRQNTVPPPREKVEPCGNVTTTLDRLAKMQTLRGGMQSQFVQPVGPDFCLCEPEREERLEHEFHRA